MPLFDPSLDAPSLARVLLGAELSVRGCGGVIIETEAYAQDDPASHSFNGPRPRNLVMFGAAGHAYIYRSYGLHLCLNVTGRIGEAVLLRALRPTHGTAQMLARRGRLPLCAGPGRLGQALGLSMGDNGRAFMPFERASDGTAFELELRPVAPELILSGPRIGVSKAADWPWRFGLRGETGLSRQFASR